MGSAIIAIALSSRSPDHYVATAGSIAAIVSHDPAMSPVGNGVISMQVHNGAKRAQGRPRLLLVEDDHGVRRSLQLLLQAQGFEVSSYSAGPALLDDPQALDAACFIADFKMGQLDGVEVLARLHERGWNGPAVLITGFPSAELEARAQAEGFDILLEKPFREHVLVDTVARLVGKTQTAAHP